jgi:GntR family transcriptional repressor for pyruvate dehydrogenase complex
MNKIPFNTIEKNILSEKIAAQLLMLIKERKVRPGEKLPPERELAAMLQVSRASLREAFRALSVIGAIVSRQGDGTYVTSLEPDLLVDHLDYVVALNDSTFINLFEARKMLETGIAPLAATRIEEDEISELERIVARMENPAEASNFLALDLEFHELIVKAARNPIYLSPYLASIRRLGRISRAMNQPVPGLPELSQIDHREILDALRRHDPDEARAAMTRHMEHIESRLQSVSPQDLLLSPAV